MSSGYLKKNHHTFAKFDVTKPQLCCITFLDEQYLVFVLINVLFL